MRIVVDTNVIISGLFFGGNPSKVLMAIVDSKVNALATKEIINEYINVIERMMTNKTKSFELATLDTLFTSFELIDRKTVLELSRDPDDNKFIECAIDGNAMYIVSGDNDLLVLKQYNDIKIITVNDFCDIFNKNN